MLELLEPEPTTSTNPPDGFPALRPRAAWMIDENDCRTDAEADADWRSTTHMLLGSSSTVAPAHPSPIAPNKPSSLVRLPPVANSSSAVPEPPAVRPHDLQDGPAFAAGETIHYLTLGLQGGTITAIYKPGEGFNPHDSPDLLYLIARPISSHTDNQPLLVPATLLRKIPPNAPIIPTYLPTGLSLDGRSWTEEATLAVQNYSPAEVMEDETTIFAHSWLEDQGAAIGYTTEEDNDDDANLFSPSWWEEQIAAANLFNIDEMGPTAIALLVADSDHTIVRRGIHTSLIHFTDHRLLVFNNDDIREVRKLIPYNRRWNYDMETYTTSVSAITYAGSHFSGGHAVNARTYVRNPAAKFPDTYSDVSISHSDIAYDITTIKEDRVTSPNRVTWIYAVEMKRSSRFQCLSPVIHSTFHAHANSSLVPHRSTNWTSQSTPTAKRRS
jgi:hypothetical protein